MPSTMKSIRARRLLAGVVAAVAAWPAAQAAHAAPEPPVVPSKIAVEDGHKPFLVGHAVGVQIYTCTAVPGGYAWSPATPRADLYDDSGKVIVTHFRGPSWQAKDGSTVVAARVDGETVDPTAIPWLLLKKSSSTTGPDGDRLTGTSYIQRVNTTGGLTPAAGQCAADTVGTATEVPYTADYVFWKALEA
jgi:Protein of unknown function (DUF3455)